MAYESLQYRTKGEEKVIADAYYFKYIFKKTEKIVCAVFYVLNKKTYGEHTETPIKDVERAAQAAHDRVLATLSCDVHMVGGELDRLTHKLVELDSKLLVLVATEYLSREHYAVFQNEIDGVIRSIRSYGASHTPSDPLFTVEEDRPRIERKAERRVRRAESKGEMQGSGTLPAESKKGSRREQIERVLIDKTEATIKDISDVVTDCSEKTIQRELNAMIKDGLVMRKGERRWSTYSRL
jgi:hypothetical protein